MQHRAWKTGLRTLLLAIPALVFAGPACIGGTPASDAGVVIRCGASLQIGPEDGARPDWGRTRRSWSATLRADTLTLFRQGQCGDECAYRDEIVLTGLDLECPRLVVARRTRSESGSPLGPVGRTIEANRGTLDFQDWSGPRGVVSGRLTAELVLTFYVRLDSLEAE